MCMIQVIPLGYAYKTADLSGLQCFLETTYCTFQLKILINQKCYIKLKEILRPNEQKYIPHFVDLKLISDDQLQVKDSWVTYIHFVEVKHHN